MSFETPPVQKKTGVKTPLKVKKDEPRKQIGITKKRKRQKDVTKREVFEKAINDLEAELKRYKNFEIKWKIKIEEKTKIEEGLKRDLDLVQKSIVKLKKNWDKNKKKYTTFQDSTNTKLVNLREQYSNLKNEYSDSKKKEKWEDLHGVMILTVRESVKIKDKMENLESRRDTLINKQKGVNQRWETFNRENDEKVEIRKRKLKQIQIRLKEVKMGKVHDLEKLKEWSDKIKFVIPELESYKAELVRLKRKYPAMLPADVMYKVEYLLLNPQKN